MANQNKAKNDAAYKKWLSEHAPLEIKAANAARDKLRKQARKEGKRKIYSHIQDERLVKKPRSSYSYFLANRFATGDLKYMKISEAGFVVGREWRALTAAQKKVDHRPQSFPPRKKQTADHDPRFSRTRRPKTRTVTLKSILRCTVHLRKASRGIDPEAPS